MLPEDMRMPPLTLTVRPIQRKPFEPFYLVETPDLGSLQYRRALGRGLL